MFTLNILFLKKIKWCKNFKKTKLKNIQIQFSEERKAFPISHRAISQEFCVSTIMLEEKYALKIETETSTLRSWIWLDANMGHAIIYILPTTFWFWCTIGGFFPPKCKSYYRKCANNLSLKQSISWDSKCNLWFSNLAVYQNHLCRF